jgi:hypothetical protein
MVRCFRAHADRESKRERQSLDAALFPGRLLFAVSGLLLETYFPSLITMANRSFVLRFVCVSLLICVCILGWSQNQTAPAATPQASPTPPQKPFTVPVDVSIPQVPTAFQGDAKTHLVYELHISNYSGQPVTLTHLEVLDEKGTELTRLGQTELLRTSRHN